MVVKRFKQAQKFFWVQEEPENMGAWSFIRPRLEAVIGKPLTYIGRRESATPATGFPHIYRASRPRSSTGPSAQRGETSSFQPDEILCKTGTI